MKRVLQLCVVLVARRSAFLPHRVRPKPRAGLSGSVSRALMRTRGQATTLVSPSGDALRKTKTSSKMPRKVDCFYVCPTVSGQATPNANRDIDPELNSIAPYQAARFSQTCRVFTPVYRQITVGNHSLAHHRLANELHQLRGCGFRRAEVKRRLGVVPDLKLDGLGNFTARGQLDQSQRHVDARESASRLDLIELRIGDEL